MTTEEKTYNLTVKVGKVLFYNDMWGIISVEPVEVEDESFKPQINKYGNFVMRGVIPVAMKQGSEHSVTLTDAKIDAKRGVYYEIVSVKVDTLKSVESQQDYLQAILTERQARLILEAFPSQPIVDMIMNNQVDLSTIKGIGDKMALSIKEKIVQNKDVGGLMAELVDFKFTGNMIKKIVKHFETATMALAKAQESLYNLCSVSGISFERVDKIALLRGEDYKGAKRIGAYSEYYFDKIANEGHSWVNERVFLEEGMATLQVHGTVIRDYLRSEDGEKHFYWNQKEYRISSMRMYRNELNTFTNLIRISSKFEAPKDIDVDKSIDIAEKELGLTYTDEQRDSIKIAIQYGVIILNGKGGTGKTTVVKGIVEVLKSLNQSTIACALSGKASQVLLSKGIDSGTIHRVFGIGIDKKEEQTGQVGYDVIVVDESSMVNAGLFSTLLKGIRDGAKLIIVGDSGQLSGIGHGDVLRDLLATNMFKKIELKQIHRQAQDSGIIELASLIRDGKQFLHSKTEGVQKFGVNGDMIVVSKQEREELQEQLIRILNSQTKLISNPYDLMDFQVVVAMREKGDVSAKEINLIAQSIFNNLDKPSVSGYGDYQYREGDKVICKGNTYMVNHYTDIFHYHDCRLFNMELYEVELASFETDDEREAYREMNPPTEPLVGDLFNGSMGIVTEVFQVYDKETKKDIDYIMVDFEGLGNVVFSQNDLDTIELAYAVTCHRLQGSTIKNVTVVLDYSAYSLLSKQWLYTAITRASKKCVLLCQSSAIVKAVATDASGNRQTFLGDMVNSVLNSVNPTESLKKLFIK